MIRAGIDIAMMPYQPDVYLNGELFAVHLVIENVHFGSAKRTSLLFRMYLIRDINFLNEGIVLKVVKIHDVTASGVTAFFGSCITRNPGIGTTITGSMMIRRLRFFPIIRCFS